MNFDDVRAIAAAWPGVEESTSYRTPALKVREKLLTRLKEDGDSLVVRDVSFEEREMRIAAEPQVFYVTDHYRDWPIVLLRLSKAHPETARTLLLRSYCAVASKTLLKAFTEGTR
jgi:hypothetical protein